MSFYRVPPCKHFHSKHLTGKIQSCKTPSYFWYIAAMISLCLFYWPGIMSAQVPASQHVVLVIEENTSYSTVTNSGNSTGYMPWLISQGNTYGHTTNYSSDTQGSAMDYFWLSSGSCHASVNCTLPAGTHDFACGGDGCFTSTGAVNPITDDNIFRELDKAGKSWKVYAESLPSAGYTGGDSGAYVDRHNPAKWYSDIFNGSTTEKSKMVPFTQFATDLAANQLPIYSIIVPNVNDDAHDGTPAHADSWLQTNVSPLLNQSYFQAGGDGLLIITFDNGDGDAVAVVYTAVIGPNVIPHSVSNTPYKHENTLRTLLDALSISTHPGASANVSAMNDFFAGGTDITVSQPLNNSTVPTTFTVQAQSSSCLGQPTASMAYSFDNLTDHIFSGATSINTSATTTNGAHILHVKAWGAGAFCKKDVNITAGVDVAVSSPANNSQVSSPFTLTASSTMCKGQSTASMAYSFDDQTDTIFNGATSINTSASTSSGAHVLRVKAWGSSGAFCETDLNITVGDVVVTTPANNASVPSTFTLQARSSSCQSQSTASMAYSFDDLTDHIFSGATSINTQATTTVGAHVLRVKAWGNSGAFCETDLNITATGDIVVTTPANNATVTSPFSLQATSTSCQGQPTASMAYSFDDQTDTIFSGATSINTSASTTSGAHLLRVKAWGNSGSFCEMDLNLTVN